MPISGYPTNSPSDGMANEEMPPSTPVLDLQASPKPFKTPAKDVRRLDLVQILATSRRSAAKKKAKKKHPAKDALPTSTPVLEQSSQPVPEPEQELAPEAEPPSSPLPNPGSPSPTKSQFSAIESGTSSDNSFTKCAPLQRLPDSPTPSSRVITLSNDTATAMPSYSSFQRYAHGQPQSTYQSSSVARGNGVESPRLKTGKSGSMFLGFAMGYNSQFDVEDGADLASELLAKDVDWLPDVASEDNDVGEEIKSSQDFEVGLGLDL
jgi:hypothetical protein